MDFTLGLIRERLREFKMEETVPLNSVNREKIINVANFSIEFISVAHSVPQTCALAIRTKYGNVLHATDWRFDDEELSMLPTDYAALRKFADEGVDMLVCESTNAMINQKLPSEAKVRENLFKLVPQIKEGLLVTCFASNMMRLESLILAAYKANRTPILIGRTLATNINIAKECGYMQNLPKVFSIEEAQDVPSEHAMYICTGSQANYRSAMSLIANGENKYVKLKS